MPEPSVCAIMLTRDRPEYARRALECFRAQTYAAKTLLIVNGGLSPILEAESGFEKDMMEPCFIGADAQSIGELRNRAAQYTSGHGVEILIHWDDDDFSHPNRIAEQVALLQSSGADVVGYNEMLFWREPPMNRHVEGSWSTPAPGCDNPTGEAWLYTNRNPTYALGTSLVYWRRVWERKPFEATSVGEDWRFLSGLKVQSVSTLWPPTARSEAEITFVTSFPQYGEVTIGASVAETAANLQALTGPRMIARIHAGNSSGAYDPARMQRASEWKRVPEWDQYCAETMR